MTAKLTGFREASRQLAGMKKAMAAGVGRRALGVPAKILADGMRERAPELEGNLKASVAVQKERSKKGRPQVAAVAADVASVQVEFGNGHQAAEPFARPAEEATRTERFEAFADALKDDAERTVIRAAKRAKG